MQRLQRPIIRKSNSISHFKNLQESKIIFNPSQFEVGQSKIQLLPQKIITRRFSQPSLPRTQKHYQSKQPKQIQTSLLMKINQKLSKQNKQLKKQLQLYKKASSRKTTNFFQQAHLSKRNLRNTIVEKINKTKCSSRLQSETGLYSSKQVSYESQSLNQMYQNYMLNTIKPSFIVYQQQLKKFFNEIQQTYMKFSLLSQSFDKNNFIQNNIQIHQYQKSQYLLKSIGSICHVKIQHEKHPGLSKPKPKVQRQPTKEKIQKYQKYQKYQKDDPLELLSPEEVVDKFQKYILKILRSPKVLKSLKANLVVRKFTKKLSEI